MKFQVPQFINIEDKIFGALSAKQFVYLAGAGGISYVLLRLLPNFIAILIIIPVVGLGLALAFVKINQKPFIFILEAAFKYAIKSKLYVWKKEEKKQSPQMVKNGNLVPDNDLFAPKLSESKLKDLSWSLDINKGAEKPNQQKNSSV